MPVIWAARLYAVIIAPLRHITLPSTNTMNHGGTSRGVGTGVGNCHRADSSYGR